MPLFYSKKHVACVSVGEPPHKRRREVETVTFIIHDFKNRNEKRSENINSPRVCAHGYKWIIQVYPRGDKGSPTDIEYSSCYFTLAQEGEDVTASYTIRCKGYKGTVKFPRMFRNGDGYVGWGFRKFLKRQSILDEYLEEDGSLVIEVDIQIADGNRAAWYPKKLQQQDVLVELYQDASSETSDVAFSVGETIYRAHKNILSVRAKKIYEMAEECDNGGPVPIHSMRGEIFKSVLDFVYAVKTPEIEKEDIAIELLVAADCYNCVDLKLYVEYVLVDKFLNAGNAAALLILADSHSCALLKEAATDLILTDKDTVKNTSGWAKIKESNRLLVELLESNVSSNASDGDIDKLDVATLREELEEADLELDGSREVLVNRLKTHRQDQATKTEVAIAS
jgi:hypothetical protein